MDTSLTPIASRDFGPLQARHLLARAGFGATPAAVRRAAADGLDKTVDRLVRYQQVDASALPDPDADPDILRPPTAEQRKARNDARRAGDQDALDAIRKTQLMARRQDRQMLERLRDWWIARFVASPRPMQEKLTLLWHGHFAAGYRQVRDAYLLYQQNQLFRENANGSFATLARGIVRDPAMIRYLNNDRNVKAKPNENLARELMELFTLGEGNYTEQDIKAGARALTGYAARDNDFQMRPGVHDSEPKKILGQVGPWNGDQFVNTLLEQDACPRYVALKLYRHFVADVSAYRDQVPPDNLKVIDAMARRLSADGYDMTPTLVTLLKSRHFYDDAIVGRKIKSPAELLLGTIHQLGTPTRDERALRGAMAGMGQELFEPPSVAGWPVGREWVNTSTLFIRQNTATYLLTGKLPGRNWKPGNLAYDPRPLLAGLDDATPAAAANHLIDALLGEHTPAARREPIVRFMQQRDKGVTQDSLVALLLLITATPEYQLC